MKKKLGLLPVALLALIPLAAGPAGAATAGVNDTCYGLKPTMTKPTRYLTMSVQAEKIEGLPADAPHRYRVFDGTPGNDVIIGTDDRDIINGNGGRDTICGRAQNDLIYVDLVPGPDGDFASNRVDAGYGDDVVIAGGRSPLFGELLANGGPGNDTIQGGYETDDNIADWWGKNYIDGDYSSSHFTDICWTNSISYVDCDTVNPGRLPNAPIPAYKPAYKKAG